MEEVPSPMAREGKSHKKGKESLTPADSLNSATMPANASQHQRTRKHRQTITRETRCEKSEEIKREKAKARRSQLERQHGPYSAFTQRSQSGFKMDSEEYSSRSVNERMSSSFYSWKHSLQSLTSPSLPLSMKAVSHQYDSPTANDHYFQLFRVFHEVAFPVLKEICITGMRDWKSGETLTDFLMRRGGTRSAYRKMFTGRELSLMNSDPFLTSFDFLLIYKLIQFACDGIAPTHDMAWHTYGTFEYHLKRLKDMRNELTHGIKMFSKRDFLTKLEELKVNLLTVLRLGNIKYNISLTEEQVTYDIDVIIDNSFSLLNEGRKDLVRFGTAEMSSLNPASAISGHDIQLNVSDIFMALEIIKTERSEDYETIHYTEILRYALEKKEKAENLRRKVIVLEGIAGSGKTTLLKFLMSDWMSGQNFVSNIGNYKFIIPIHCGHMGFSYFKDHISSLMPTARKRFKDSEQMLKSFLKYPFIILLDGIDEINSTSEKLLRDVLDLTKWSNCIIVGTTRPHKVKELYERFILDENAVHLTLNGVPVSCAEEFLIKYHEALRDFEVSREDTEELLKYFRTKGASLKDFWKLPLNLAILALLWSVERTKVDMITTTYELLQEIQNLVENKLIERLSNHSRTKYLSLSFLQDKVKTFMVSLHKEAFRELCCDNIKLQEESADNLKRSCMELQLPENEVMGAFLSVAYVQSPEGQKMQLNFPHKSWQEFYSSMHIYTEVQGIDFNNLNKDLMNTLSKHKVPSKLKNKYVEAHQLLQDEYVSNSERVTILDILMVDHGKSETSFQLNKFQNVLMMLLGVLHESKKKWKDSLITEVVGLLAKAGVKDRSQWIQILHSAKDDTRVARLIAQLPGIIEGTTRISEQETLAYAILLRDKRPDRVAIEFTGKISRVPYLREFLEVVVRNKCKVECLSLSDWYGNTNRDVISSFLDIINQLMKRCEVMEYRGPLIPRMELSKSIKWLEVRVDNCDSFENLHTLLSQKLTQLESLSVCIPTNLDPQDLKSLPGTRAKGKKANIPAYHLTLDLLLLDVQSKNDFNNAADIARKLQPSSGNCMFQRIFFPRMELDSKEVTSNASCLKGIRTCTVEFPSCLGFASEQDKERFEDLVTEVLDCQSVCWGSSLHVEEER